MVSWLFSTDLAIRFFRYGEMQEVLHKKCMVKITLSLKENERKLSSYLLRFIHKSDKTNATNFRLVHLKPKTIKRYKSFNQDNERNREIILSCAIRLARTDPVDALAALRHYASIYAFDQKTSNILMPSIFLGRSDTTNM